MPGAWKEDPVHCREVHSLDLTFLQMMGRSLAGHLEGEVRSGGPGGSTRAGSDVSRKQHLISTQRLSSRLTTWTLGPQSDLPSDCSPAN